jgi:uroporphyrinogen decarboxylase
MNLTHRERISTTLHHVEPDRVPIDLGGTVDSSIAVVPYRELRKHLELDARTIRVADVCQQAVLLDEDVRGALGIDTVSIQYEPEEWRTDELTYDFTVQFPARFQPEVQEDGSQVVLDSARNVLLRMPKEGYYFDSMYSPLAEATGVDDIDRHIRALESYDRPAYLDKSYEHLAQEAKDLYENSDHLLVGFFGGHIFQSSQSLRGWETFLMDLIANRKFAEALMDRFLQVNIERFARYADTIGKYVQVIHVEDDLGMQDRPLLSPELYRRMVKPYHKRLFGFVKSHCDAYLMLHSDGSVFPLIPDFIEMGIDILNPVQVSAKDMDTKRLKREFGQDIAFWGAGCDSQEILPFGTPEEVRDEVKRRIDDLAPGGGFVFSPIHNVQSGVPLENIIAMFETVREYGVH